MKNIDSLLDLTWLTVSLSISVIPPKTSILSPALLCSRDESFHLIFSIKSELRAQAKLKAQVCPCWSGARPERMGRWKSTEARWPPITWRCSGKQKCPIPLGKRTPGWRTAWVIPSQFLGTLWLSLSTDVYTQSTSGKAVRAGDVSAAFDCVGDSTLQSCFLFSHHILFSLLPWPQTLSSSPSLSFFFFCPLNNVEAPELFATFSSYWPSWLITIYCLVFIS